MLYSTLAFITSGDGNDSTHLTPNEVLSGILGSVSLACWIFLLLPQLVENYRNQSAEAISLAFVIVWFLGDICNLFGALWASLVPSVIIIGVWFCISDGLLIGQCLYYGIRNKRREGRSLLASVKDVIVETETGSERFSDADGRRSIDDAQEDSSRVDDGEATETEPLLSRTHSRRRTNSYTIPGSADPATVRAQLARQKSSAGSANMSRSRRKSSSTAAASAQAEPLAKIFEESETGSTTPSTTQRAFKNALLILGVVLVGSLGWLIAYETGTWHPTPPPDAPSSQPDHDDDDDAIASPAAAQLLGYASAVLYLTARLPQIWKNYREKSTEGLSILFFILSLMGNATYGAAVLAHSLQGDYVLKNLPWLIGSLGTIAEDMIVFWQFRLYRNNIEENEEHVAIVDGPESGAMSQRGPSRGDETTIVEETA
ncbi:hypothetical protein H2198_004212 [Neophaeococcomyces mojaviensis]|uniref:Uncharacterized protein n=1 Tax=Neophaeococcomyces mojaviensis TaxID=3383035 RepID=A0ACC3A9K1_9EURO|nr:hypothetical protein H2198_004212 [Knufia sp. JES_112]